MVIFGPHAKSAILPRLKKLLVKAKTILSATGAVNVDPSQISQQKGK